MCVTRLVSSKDETCNKNRVNFSPWRTSGAKPEPSRRNQLLTGFNNLSFCADRSSTYIYIYIFFFFFVNNCCLELEVIIVYIVKLTSMKWCVLSSKKKKKWWVQLYLCIFVWRLFSPHWILRLVVSNFFEMKLSCRRGKM